MLLAIALLAALLAAGPTTRPGIAAPPPATRPTAVEGFRLAGDRWTYRDAQRSFDGILLKPDGEGPFPAILLSHGMGGNASGFALPKARKLAARGFVCLAPNYTHSIQIMDRTRRPVPGDPKGPGASEENLARAEKCLEILRSLPYVDPQRLYAYGHSMGGFVTIALAARNPDLLKAAAVSGSGVAPRGGFAAPSAEDARRIRTPFCLIHGEEDRTVPAERSAMLKAVLDANNVSCDRHVFAGVDHPVDQERAAEVLDLLVDWFGK